VNSERGEKRTRRDIDFDDGSTLSIFVLFVQQIEQNEG